MEIDPKTIVWYPLYTLLIYFILSLFFDLPFWTLFLVLFLVFLYIVVIIIIELKK
ncbi:hypothetical protein [Alkalibacterium olivapovliticus]|uniref:Uncharacterized protein n=1 Tax=Alkalibacterium olivapovliticus TaxID=99907 RepID=A0A2T0W5H9_9LACT|nr:hypothetical protein [Alkalibacterium olivapovliticus]MCC5895380.1 hypothetical protein [Alkalibacterium sp.]PRY80989.1 hypothetical protein CLV38_12050 [Alkalibacterium olivapovliticus]